MKAFVPFYTYFPEIADKEAKVVQILRSRFETPLRCFSVIHGAEVHQSLFVSI